MSCDVTLEIVFERFSDRRHRRQREQLRIGQWTIRRSLRRQDTGEREAAAIKFAQSKRIDDCGPALERRALRGGCCKRATKKQENGGPPRSRDHAPLTPRDCVYSSEKRFTGR